MKKIPCLFQREFHERGRFTLLQAVTPGCEWVLAGEGTASRKWDGTACMVRDGVLYKRYDAKRGKVAPPGAIPCDEPDSVTGHHPHWVPVDADNPADKWHAAMWREYDIGSRDMPRLANGTIFEDGTYELVGPHFNGNPEEERIDVLHRHGDEPLSPPRTFDGLRQYLSEHRIEGIVFTHPDGRMCKIRRNDFSLPWGNKR
jgi:hypothetical protein